MRHRALFFYLLTVGCVLVQIHAQDSGLDAGFDDDVLVPISGYKVFDNKIALGGYSTAFVNETNGVFEWGILTNANEPRKLVFLDPHGNTIDFTADKRQYDILDMSCGGYYCLALVQDAARQQTMYGWGRLPLSDSTHLHPVVLAEFTALLAEHRIKKISAGYSHALFVTTTQQLVVWGEGKSGQLGIDSVTATTSPLVVSSLTERAIHVKAACAGGHHSLLLSSEGEVYATGWNKFGQLGRGTDEDTRVFEPVSLPERASKLSCGGDHSLALTKSGSIYTWGWGENGQLGHGSMDNSHAPLRVSGSKLFIQAVASPYGHTLALTKSREVYSFGWGAHGQLGHGSRVSELVPRKISSLKDIIIVAAGFKHSAFVNKDGELYLMGDSEYFQVPGASGENMRIEEIVTWHADGHADEENTTALPTSDEFETIVL